MDKTVTDAKGAKLMSIEDKGPAMSNVDTRQVDRDSLFLLAQLRVDGQSASYRVKVRNLSAGGMMAESEAVVSRGSLVHIDLRNIGWVEGTVAWKQGDRFGIAFVKEIDPKQARDPIKSSRGSSSLAGDSRLRKI